ncbi:hypothetical protein BSKO_12882 [Bryopsis sp. KO-2023]|nr:hypothetical protein BSKO_12882 [Bryopsis sp. KO-2023]
MSMIMSISALPWALSEYRLCKRASLPGIWENASGVTYSHETGTIWVVSRSPLKLVEYDLDGNLMQEFDLPGMRDPEGVAWMWGGLFAVAEEASHIQLMNMKQGYMEETGRIWVELPGLEPNLGLEGLAFDLKHRCFYVVEEKNGKNVLQVSLSGRNKVLFKSHHLNIGDMAGIYYSNDNESLFILSQESKTVSKVDLEGELLESIGIAGVQPEGLTFSPDGERMIIVSEPNELYVYSAGPC